MHDRHSAMDWAVRIGDAIEQGRLRLYAQGIVALKPVAEAHLRHFEVLLRIEDPNTGKLLEPGPYISAAERFRFATRIDRAVLTQTLDWFDAHPAEAAEVARILDDSARTPPLCVDRRRIAHQIERGEHGRPRLGP